MFVMWKIKRQYKREYKMLKAELKLIQKALKKVEGSLGEQQVYLELVNKKIHIAERIKFLEFLL